MGEGVFENPINSIAQSPDGYLWLGTDFGLLRFDGIKPIPWSPPPSEALPSNLIKQLVVAADGTLWIGTSKGLASWKNGKLTSYPDLAGQNVLKMIESGDGTIWVGTFGIPTARLYSIRNRNVETFGSDGSLGGAVVGLYEDHRGNLWVGASNGLWHWAPGPPKLILQRGPDQLLPAINEDADGTLLIGGNDGIYRLVDGKTEAYPPLSGMAPFQAPKMQRDRDGSIWIGTVGQGIVHVHDRRADVFTMADGLSAEHVSRIFEDREGTIWVATSGGLDRFRDLTVSTFGVRQGLSSSTVGSVLADRDGNIWVSATRGVINRWRQGQITRLDTGEGDDARKPNRLTSGSLFQDSSGRIWAFSPGEARLLENDRVVETRNVPAGIVHSVAEDAEHNLWISTESAGLVRLSPQGEVQQTPWAKLGHEDSAPALIADSLHGGIWLGFFRGGLAYLQDGAVRVSYTATDGLGEGRINSLRMDPDGTLWAATEGGLSRIKDGHISTLSSKNGLPCDSVHWMIGDNANSFWLETACGLVRISRSEFEAWAKVADKGGAADKSVQVAVFDSFDGVRSRGTAGGYSPLVAKASDGKVWFIGSNGVNVVDPGRLPFNSTLPPVHVEKIIGDHKVYDLSSIASPLLQLPRQARDLEIDYTALSMAATEKVLFRYKLENWDRDWQDAGTRRQAFYDNLPPGKYRFRVMACNNSGVWNETGALLDFDIPPMYYQTTWFRMALVALFVGLLVIAYRLRLRQVARHFNMRLEERVGERTRIARDLHDTLLQSFQGVVFKFSAVVFLLPEKPDEARNTLEGAVNQASQALNDGRRAVQGLRASTVITNDLAQAISAAAEELASDESGSVPAFNVDVEGDHRDLVPLVRDEVTRIAAEALRNAFQHADASRIDAVIRYDTRQLQLKIKDNGRGIDQAILDAGGRAGHYGLAGMRERAQLAGGKLTIRSQLDSGTQVELTIPGVLAYAKAKAPKWADFFKTKG